MQALPGQQVVMEIIDFTLNTFLASISSSISAVCPIRLVVTDQNVPKNDSSKLSIAGQTSISLCLNSTDKRITLPYKFSYYISAFLTLTVDARDISSRNSTPRFFIQFRGTTKSAKSMLVVMTILIVCFLQ